MKMRKQTLFSAIVLGVMLLKWNWVFDHICLEKQYENISKFTYVKSAFQSW